MMGSIGNRNRAATELAAGTAAARGEKRQAVAFWAVELDKGGAGGGGAASLACVSARSNWGQSYKKCSAVGSFHCSGWHAVTLVVVPFRGWQAAQTQSRGRAGYLLRVGGLRSLQPAPAAAGLAAAGSADSSSNNSICSCATLASWHSLASSTNHRPCCTKISFLVSYEVHRGWKNMTAAGRGGRGGVGRGEVDGSHAGCRCTCLPCRQLTTALPCFFPTTSLLVMLI